MRWLFEVYGTLLFMLKFFNNCNKKFFATFWTGPVSLHVCRVLPVNTIVLQTEKNHRPSGIYIPDSSISGTWDIDKFCTFPTWGSWLTSCENCLVRLSFKQIMNFNGNFSFHGPTLCHDPWGAETRLDRSYHDINYFILHFQWIYFHFFSMFWFFFCSVFNGSCGIIPKWA